MKEEKLGKEYILPCDTLELVTLLTAHLISAIETKKKLNATMNGSFILACKEKELNMFLREGLDVVADLNRVIKVHNKAVKDNSH